MNKLSSGELFRDSSLLQEEVIGAMERGETITLMMLIKTWALIDGDDIGIAILNAIVILSC